MATAQTMTDDCLVSRAKREDLQEMLREVGLAGEYWLPKLQEHLGITCAQALQHLETKDLQKLESQTRYPWEKRALEKMLNISRSNSLSESEEPQVEMIERRLMQAEQALQELRGLLSAGKQQMEEAVRTAEAEMRQPMDSPKQCWPSMQIVQNEVLEDNQRQHTHLEGSLAHRQNLPDRELVRWASGGLALQGIYKTSSGRDLIEKREELLSVPEDFSLSAPEQDPRMETKEFASSEEESSFTQTLEKLGFSATAAAKEGGWGFNLEAGGDHSKHSDSKKTQQSHSQHSYFCLTKFKYVPLASCCFPVDQLQLSKAALQELQCFEDILSQPAGRDRHLLMRDRAEAFFYRFGSHANQGPLHLGGIYWWKAVSEGFQSDQLARVKQHSADALDSFIRNSYKGSGREAVAGIDVPASPANIVSQEKSFQIKVQLSTSQTGGPPETDNLKQWKAGLVVSNHTWCVIDRGLQLVPVWNIILTSHSSDFKYPLQVANCLKERYMSLTGLPVQNQDAELLSTVTEARVAVENMKYWKVSDPEGQLKFVDELQKQYQSLSHEKNQFQKPHNDDNSEKDIENEIFLELLKRLGLENYYPKGMSRAHFHLIQKASVYKTQLHSEQELPDLFLQKLLVLDYGLRYLVFKDDGNTEMQDHPSATCHENKVFDPYEDLSEDSDESTHPPVPDPRPHIHPMDIQMAILHCADDFARQYILGKLATCQFALPLLIPDPCSSQIEFSLWSLSQIRRSWQQSRKSANEKGNFKNQQMCQVSTPIVSFIRVGNGFSASKSQIMNCLVSQRKHDVFFHRHCRGSINDSLLMKGVVEICWFCPGGEEEDRFDNCLTFTNLHGDAKEHEKQLTFLHEVSSLLVVLMSVSDDNKRNRELVHDLCQSSKPVIFLLDDKEKVMSTKSAQKVRIGIRNRNEAELTEEIATTIKFLLERSDATFSLQDCAQVARTQGFLVDEDQRDCKEAKEKAESLMDLLGDMHLSQVKEKLLPLQGELWHLWCKKDKELYHLREKGNCSIEQHKTEVQTEKQRIRHQQLTRAFPLNDLMRSVLEILQGHLDTHTKVFFLQWLSVFLDTLTAGHLEKLNKDKMTLWSIIQREKQKVPKSDSLKCRQNEFEAISKAIYDCTLGTEQLLREVGQIYEAMEESALSNYSLYQPLPQMAADLMIAGVPIELMDGDTSYVPLKWVAAVFDKVSETLGDKRLFVLSILGLQSSGKSTLLNALFGLEFTVSAGRCTQGAYMQLLKVEETFAQEVGFDFVLVVDTEGLRAPELNSKSQDRDNELATFVIGLGNLTLINIFGENPSEMQDILQIVVQAFLRMKQVKISPTCLFVHQNVGEVTAEDQTMEGRRWLEQRLDTMAAMAAEQEQCSEVTCFSDVIKFDINTHVFYFAHLWDGNPPMAPPNPRYSHNVQELKSRILMTAKQESRGSILKISNVKQRVQDLWRALVSENFIFSFRNTQEVMAMSRLETMYNTWSWSLRSHVLDLQDKLTYQIHNGKTKILIIEDLHDPVTQKYENIQQELEKYFSEDPDSEILVQWKARFENKLISLKDTLIQESHVIVNEHIGFKKNQERLNSKMAAYEKELLERSQDLALGVKDKKLSENELYEIFSQCWQNCVSELSPNLPPLPEPDIHLDAEAILLDYFMKETDLVHRLKENFGKEFKINLDKHIKVCKLYGLIPTHLQQPDIESINVTTDHINSRCIETIENIKRENHDYNKNYFHEILKIVDEEVKSAPTKEKYTFTNEYIFDLSCWLFHRASQKFREIHEQFKRINDPKFYLEGKKDDFFMSFKIACQGATSVKMFVDYLWNKLTPAISNTIKGKIGLTIAGDMRTTCPAFNGNRTNLEKHILISLAEEENFENYVQYLHYPELFFRNYIANHIRRYFSEEGTGKIKKLLKINLGTFKHAILSVIHECTAQTKDKNTTVSVWLDMFCDLLGRYLIFPRKDLISIEHQEIKDIDFLREAMNEALDPAMKMVEQDCLNMSVEEILPKTEKMLFTHLCGCWKQCPGCGAMCTNTIPTHEGDHSVPFHRPLAVNGRKWKHTDHFVIDFCTSLVASNCSFLLQDGRKIPYKAYRLAGGEYAKWSINPDTSTQPYWKWFLYRFRSEIEKKYHKKFVGKGAIPKAWTKITKQHVLDVLKNSNIQ